jgi:hypothetical protein
MTSKRIILGALCALALACGDDKPDPASRHFEYGAPLAPTYDEQYAADTGEVILSDGADYRTSDDPLVAETAGDSLPSLPDTMGSAMFGGDLSASLAAPALSKGVAAAFGGMNVTPLALGDGFDNPGCVTLVPGRITYSNCAFSSIGMPVEIDGWVSRVGDVIAWDLDATMSFSDVDGAVTVRTAVTGSIAVTASTISGGARSDVSASGNYQGTSIRMGYTTLADLDLTYQPVPFCVTGGTLEVRRVWTQQMAGAQEPDQGAKLTWLGCDIVQVARSL